MRLKSLTRKGRAALIYSTNKTNMLVGLPAGIKHHLVNLNNYSESHNGRALTGSLGDRSFKFLPYQLDGSVMDYHGYNG